MGTIDFSRGSEWRKWDLHIHAPSIFTCAKRDVFAGSSLEEKRDNFIAELKQVKDISVIGITDYFSLDGYKFVQENRSELSQFNLILPNIELRITPVTSRNTKINLHIIPNTEILSIDEIERFLYKFEFGTDKLTCKKNDLIILGKKLDSALSDEKAFERGLNEFTISYDKFFDVYNEQSDKIKNNILIGVSNSCNDGASGIKDIQGIRNVIYRGVHFIFSPNPSDRDYFAGVGSDSKQTIIQKYGTVKPCIHGSDYHGSKEGKKLCVPDLNRYCWIKGNTTFNGLKQVLYEPLHRVHMQEMSPDNKLDYQVLNSIILNEANFWNQEIQLNPYLNTIIGGRSTGKSSLLECIAKKIDPSIQIDNEKRRAFVEAHFDKLVVKWKDGETTINREIMYFPQNHMIKLAENKDELNKLIEGIVKDKDQNNCLDGYKHFCEQNRIEIANLVNQLFLVQSKIDTLVSTLKEKGDAKSIQQEITKLTAKINDIKSNSQISEEELKAYNSHVASISQKESTIKIVENDIYILNLLNPNNIFNPYFENELSSLSEDLLNILKTFLTQIRIEMISKWDNNNKKLIEDLSNKVITLKKEIQIIQSDNIYIKGQDYFKKNKEYSELQEQLKKEQEKLAAIKEVENQKNVEIASKKNLLVDVINKHILYFSKLKELIDVIHFSDSDVSITSGYAFKENHLKDFLTTRHNLRGYDRQCYIDTFTREYNGDDMRIAIKKYVEDALNNNIDYKSGNASNIVVSELLSTNWFDITYDLAYENDSFDDMSQGKKSFVILKLLLDFSDKKCPILIDQPEDSLDNRAIYNELVQYIRNKKLSRQLIIVTHNANVVVSADSENVIVANQNGSKNKNRNGIRFEYLSGALEETSVKDNNNQYILESRGIREHVCDILEGGEDAFKEREQKYGL